VKNFFIAVVIVFALLSPVYLLLWKAYENSLFDDIVEKQVQTGAIYGTSLNQNQFSYKLALIKSKKPDIIALGSSRMMQFREESFTTSFVNAGGGMHYLTEGKKFLENMLKFHKPKHILLGLDFWWFNPNYFDVENYPHHSNTGNIFTLKKLTKPIEYIYTDKVSINTIFDIILDNRKNNITKYDNLGFQAINSSEGFRSDGSYFYSNTIFGIKPHDDEKFKNTIFRIDHSASRFEYGNELSKKRIKKLNNILQTCKENNIDVTIIIPPLAPKIIDKIRLTNKYLYIDKFRDYISKLDLENYNFHNPRIIDSDNCEFIDGFHGGDITYQKMLLYMYNHKSKIANYINVDSIKESRDKFNGKVLTIFDSQKYSDKYKEIDFLNLDCKK
jgi:hypothetical protein